MSGSTPRPVLSAEIHPKYHTWFTVGLPTGCNDSGKVKILIAAINAMAIIVIVGVLATSSAAFKFSFSFSDIDFDSFSTIGGGDGDDEEEDAAVDDDDAPFLVLLSMPLLLSSPFNAACACFLWLLVSTIFVIKLAVR